VRSLASGLAAIAVGVVANAADAQTGRDDEELQALIVREAEKELEDELTAIQARLSPEQRSLLDRAQLSWTTFRSDHCRLQASGVAGGSAYSLIYGVCLEDLTRNRIRQLEYLLDCEEGDLSCPAPKPP
jgi:uncharacterized protein YecT (DUF1311 family)